MSVRINYIPLTIRELKTHYSEEIEAAIERYIERGKSLILTAAPGSGKTFGSVHWSIKVLAGVSPAITRLGAKPEIVYYLSPTHLALEDAANKVIRIYKECIGLPGFISMPRAFILRGAFYSCVNARLRDTISEEIYEIFRELIPPELREKGVTPAKWVEHLRRTVLDVEIAESPEVADIRQVRKLLDDIIRYYSFYSMLDRLYSYICGICPYRKYYMEIIRNGKAVKVDLVEELINFVAETGVQIVDSGVEHVEQLMRDFMSYLGVDEPICIYKLLFKFAIAESEYRAEGRRRKKEEEERRRKIKRGSIIFLMTHAMLSNPIILESLKERYRLPTSVGRPVKHVIILDEFDNLILNSPVARLPIHIKKGVDRVTESTIEQIARRMVNRNLVTPSKRWRAYVDAMKRLIKLGRELYELIDSYIVGTYNESERAFRIVKAFRKWYEEKFSSSDELRTLVRLARRFLDLWRRAILREMIERNYKIDPDEVSAYITANEVVQFFSSLLESYLPSLPDENLAIALSFLVGMLGVNRGITVRSFILPHSREKRLLSVFTTGDFMITLYDMALRFIFDPSYPYLYLAKIGVTATFGHEIIDNLLRHLLTDDIVKCITGKLAAWIDITVPYSGLSFYKIAAWASAVNYERAVYVCEAQLYGESEYYEAADKVAGDLKVESPRKSKLTEKTTKQNLVRITEFTRALDVILNLIHELYYIITREHLAEVAKMEYRRKKREEPSVYIFVFIGTSPQYERIATELYKLDRYCRMVGPVKHGVLRITCEILKRKREENGKVIEEYDVGKDYIKTRFHIVDKRGVKYTLRVDFSYANSRYSRGIDLENYDCAVILSPPLSPPDDLLSYYFGGIIPGEYVGRNILKTVSSTAQCLFRIVRKIIYERPKVIALDYSLFQPKYINLAARWFREQLEFVKRTPVVTLIDNPEELPDRYTP